MYTQPLLAPVPPQPPRLLDLVGQVAHARFGQDGPTERYVHWTRRLILFHNKRHPRDLEPGDVGRFLEHLAETEKDPLNCVEQAHTALTFLYNDGEEKGDIVTPAPRAAPDRRSREGLGTLSVVPKPVE